MMELRLFLQICMLFFGVMGYLRGVYREFISTVGILVSLFFLTQFDWIIGVLVPRMDAGIRFGINAIYIIAFAFFSYQQAATVFVPSRYRGSRGKISLPEFDNWQMKLVGAALGAFNGYLIVGSLWYFMDLLEYPFSGLFLIPRLESASANFVTWLPLVWLQQGNLIVWLVMGLFLLVVIFR